MILRCNAVNENIGYHGYMKSQAITWATITIVQQHAMARSLQSVSNAGFSVTGLTMSLRNIAVVRYDLVNQLNPNNKYMK